MTEYLPEGYLIGTAENRIRIGSPAALRESMESGSILEARCAICDSKHNLIVELGCNQFVEKSYTSHNVVA